MAEGMRGEGDGWMVSIRATNWLTYLLSSKGTAQPPAYGALPALCGQSSLHGLRRADMVNQPLTELALVGLLGNEFPADTDSALRKPGSRGEM